MNRLTHYGRDGRPHSSRGYEVALARLAAYEDTGLEPEEIKAKLHLQKMPKLKTICRFTGAPCKSCKGEGKSCISRRVGVPSNGTTDR